MESFCPVIWPEEPVPDEVEGCEICGLYEHGSRMVWGEGSPDAPIMIVLDNPGLRENKEGEAFVCGTRQTLQQAASEVGLNKKDLYLTYVLKRRPARAYDKLKTRRLCIGHLEEQCQMKSPSLIFCLGNVAVQSFFDDSKAQVKKLRGQLHEVKGFSVLTSYHPLAVRRRPNLSPFFMEDWRLLAEKYRSV